MIFWYLYWFQIFKDQCGSVPSIPVAVLVLPYAQTTSGSGPCHTLPLYLQTDLIIHPTKNNLICSLPLSELDSTRNSKCYLLWSTALAITGTPPLTRFFGPGKNRVKGKPRYRRSILVLKPQNGEFEISKSTFSLVFTIVKNREKVDFEFTNSPFWGFSTKILLL